MRTKAYKDNINYPLMKQCLPCREDYKSGKYTLKCCDYCVYDRIWLASGVPVPTDKATPIPIIKEWMVKF